MDLLMYLKYAGIFVLLLVAYLIIGALVSAIIDNDYWLNGEYYVLLIFAYPIALPIFVYFELKKFVKELKEEENDF